MALTKNETEAKLFALEDRIALLTQVVDNLENRFEQGVEQWTNWALGLRALSETIARQMAQIRNKLP